MKYLALFCLLFTYIIFGKSPDSLTGLTIKYIEYENIDGVESRMGEQEGKFSNNMLTAWDDDDKANVSEPYTYTKTGDNTGTLRIAEGSDVYEAQLTFDTDKQGNGTWTEKDEEGSFGGRLTFEIIDEGSTASNPFNFIPPPEDAIVAQVLVPYYNPNTGESWTSGTGGWTAPDGWIQGTREEYEQNQKSNSGLVDGGSTGVHNGTGKSPDNLTGLTIKYIEYENVDGVESRLGEQEGKFSINTLTAWDDDDKANVSEPYTYTKTGDNTGTLRIAEGSDVYEAQLTFDTDKQGTGIWTEKDEEGSFGGRLTFEIIDEGSANVPGDETQQPGNAKDNENNSPEVLAVPVREVEDFVANEIKSYNELSGKKPIWAEKIFDTFNRERFVYIVGMDGGIALYFNQNKQLVHAAPSDEYAPIESKFLPESAIPQELKTAILSEVADATILDADQEYSVLDPSEKNSIYSVFFDADEEEYVAHFTSAKTLIIITKDNDEDFDDDYKPVEIPGSVKTHIQKYYSDIVENIEHLHAEERPTPDGTGKEIVVFLGDGLDIIFDPEGKFLREINVWKEFEENLDAGLKFDAENSSKLGPDQHVNISKIDNLRYLIQISEKIDLGVQGTIENFSSYSHNESTVLENLELTFTYDFGPLSYIIVNGSNISKFSNRLPESDKPGSFSLRTSYTMAYNFWDDNHSWASLGFVVQIGGDRDYNCALFETNLPLSSIINANFSSPWDPVLSFAYEAELNSRDPLFDTLRGGAHGIGLKAHIPRSLLSGRFGLMDPYEVKSASINKDGNLNYLDHDFVPYSSDSQGDNNSNIKSSVFDFNGDGKANSYLEVSLSLPEDLSGEVEIQIGDPYVDPYANINESEFGSISGSVTDNEGKGLEEYDVIFFRKPDSGNFHDMYNQPPVFFDLERDLNGAFTARLPAGEYYAEAFGYDPQEDIPYKPQLFGGLGNPKLINIEESKLSEETLQFVLEPEFRVSRDFTKVEGKVVVDGNDEIGHVLFDFYPVEGGNQVTDYPVFTLGVEQGGRIEGMVPIGKFKVKVFSHDNSVKAQTFDLELLKGEDKIFPEIKLIPNQLVTLSGSINDNAGNPVWAEIILVDANDPELRFWPMPLEIGLPEGEFAVKVPAGNYKILAERFDGLYQSSFYTGPKANDGVVTIQSDVNGIDFVLEARPTATVKVKLLENGDPAKPVKYAWFDFFDPEDEFAPIVFPHLEGINFDDQFDGSYTLSVPEGDYKLSIGAHNFEGVFRVIDESGSETWHSGSWCDGSTIYLKVGETTDLGNVNMTSLGKSDAELYGFDWLGEGEVLSGGSTVKGTLKTSSGVAVPKARIIAHTIDYIFWFDHIQSRTDGSFELNNLPEGEWIIFAEPPFDSQSFRGFRESKQEIVLLSEGETESVDLILQESNVFGRILFPKKNHQSCETKNNGLGHAFVWAYKDNDQDGEPDWADPASGENEELTEVFGETDENGYFSFYLDEAGKYSLRIDLPGQLSALSPEPIGFTVKNPNQATQLGNAVRIDWKSKVQATEFDIQRKLTSESSYVSLFAGEDNASKPGANAKSFVVSKAKPGESYDYRVIAETKNGKVTIETANVRVSEPFIYLAPPSKTIAGRVVDKDNSPIANAEVVAWREEGEGWSSTFTGDDGSYELVAGPGRWEITVYRPHDIRVDWFYESVPKRVRFANDTKKESKTKNFVVTRGSGGKVVGSIQLPNGVSATELSQYVYVDIFDPEGRGNWGQPDQDGKFEIPLEPGEYELTIWVDSELKKYGSPMPRNLRVGKNTIELPYPISLVSRDKTLTGKVAIDTTGKGLPNVEVWAWSDEGGWVSDTTNVNGEYSLSISSGRWEIGYDLPMAEDGSELPYMPSPPKRVRIKEGRNIPTIDFTVRPAGAKIDGTVYGVTNSPLSGLDAWIYAREYSEDDEYSQVLADVPLTSKGTFSFPSVPGKYWVGMWLSPDSGYSFPNEKIYTVKLNDDTNATVLLDENDTQVSEISFMLAENDSIISGKFSLSGSDVTGLTGEVYAIRVDGDGWQSTAIEDDGTYKLVLAEGTWALDYYIEADASDRKIPAHPAQPITVKSVASSTVSQDFTLRTASASISGKAIYESNGSAVVESTLYIWAYRDGNNEYWDEVKTDENGSFSIPVLPGGFYEVGAILPVDLREQGYLDAAVLRVDLSSNVTDLNLTISKANAYIAGKVLGVDGSPVVDATVYAWADDGRETHGITDTNGDFNVSVVSGSVWHVGAEAEIDENDTINFYFTNYETDVDLGTANSKSGLELQLQAPTFELPEGTSVTFDPTKDFVTKLPDGSEITILGGSANFASDVTEVRLVITPTAKGLSKSADEKPADYGYSLELFDNKGKKMEGNFKKDVIISIPVNINASLAKGMDVNNIEGMYYSTTKDAWDKAKTSTWDKNSSTLTLTIDHFTTVAAVAPVDVADISSGLSKMNGGAIGDWYSSDWFGDYHDASSGWIYHTQLGWLYTKQDTAGNFWLYEENLGWLWASSSHFEINSSTKSHLYSSSKGNWLFFSYANGKKNFYDYSLDTPDWITP